MSSSGRTPTISEAAWPRLVRLTALALSCLAVSAAGLAAQQAGATAADAACGRLLLSAWSHVDSVYWNRAFIGREWRPLRDRITGEGCRGGPRAALRRLLGRVGDPAVRLVDSTGVVSLLSVFGGRPPTGVGLLELLSVDIDERTGLLTVVTPVPGGPAARAGLRPGDVIERIDGRRSDTLDLGAAASRLRGSAGTPVTLRIRRGAKRFDVRLEREDLPPIQPIRTALYARPNPIGYIRILQFVPGTSAAVDSALARLARRGARGWILDLRDDPGGLVEELVGTADLLLGPGRPIVRFASRPGGDTVLVTSGEARTDLPLVVLVNHGSASAAEALAGALQADGRATVIGERTFGKGLVHRLLPLAHGRGVMVPNARLRTPRGRDILSRGIEPDVSVASPTLREAGAASPEDPLVRAALDRLDDAPGSGSKPSGGATPSS